ncbi:MAG: hypothetical protein KC503_36780, partial [Myxococcales bacterium]|nr:hypothetical protein [Myxococcales bacterium]
MGSGPDKDLAALQAELDAARDELRVLRDLLVAVPDYISHVDLEGRLLFLNRSTQPFEQLRSLSLFDVLAETDRA